jgi:hypothetical protein
VGKKRTRPDITAINRDTFWQIIDWARTQTSEHDDLAETVSSFLVKMPPEQIKEFDDQLRERLRESYRHDLWAVAYIINGGCSDEGFEDFRGWLIAQGRDFFEEVLKEPARAAERVPEDEDEAEYEYLLTVAQEAYQQRAGKELPPSAVSFPSQPAGERWEEDDLERLYPDLCKRFF